MRERTEVVRVKAKRDIQVGIRVSEALMKLIRSDAEAQQRTVSSLLNLHLQRIYGVGQLPPDKAS